MKMEPAEINELVVLHFNVNAQLQEEEQSWMDTAAVKIRHAEHARKTLRAVMAVVVSLPSAS